MQIPEDVTRRDALYAQTIQRCGVSRNTRLMQYTRWKRWYLTGAEEMRAARFNKLRAHTDLLCAYLYAQEQTRFAVTLPPYLARTYFEHLDIATEEFEFLWHEFDGDSEFDTALEWSLPYGCTLLKVLTIPAPCLRYLNPWQFGVLQEDVPEVEEQEAMVHWFHISLSQLERHLAGHPRKTALLDALAAAGSPEAADQASDTLPPAMGAIVVSQVTPTIIGTAAVGAGTGMPEAKVEEPTTELAELWIWDDDREDYRCVTWSERVGQVVWERRNPTLPGESPFIRVAPFGDPNYFWGLSEMEHLIELQRWREDQMVRIDSLLKKQLKPPRSFTGAGGLSDEKLAGLNTPGGLLNFNNPMAKVQDHAPQMPPDAFAEIHEIDTMFGEAGGLPTLLEGRGDAGMRAGLQTDRLAQLGGARARRRAFKVEDILEAAATKVFRVHRRLDDTVYALPDGGQFLLSQLPDRVTIRVNAHSSSPLAAEVNLGKADRLMKAKAIDGPTYVDMIDPPMRQMVKAKAHRLQKEQAEASQKRFETMAAIQHEKATKSSRR